METFNNWLYNLQNSGHGVDYYNLTGTITMALMFVAILFYVWRQRLNPFKALVIGFLARYFLGYAHHFMTWYRRDFDLDRYFGTANIGYAFVLLPLLCWLCDKTFNVKDGTSGELVAISTMAWHWVGRSGCTFTGCCYGIPCEWGVYSRHAGGNTFPVCWLESLLTIGILIFLLIRLFRRGPLLYKPTGRSRVMDWYLKGRRQPDDGKALPYMLLFYGTGRFFTEFFRYHPAEDILFGFLPEFSVHALLMALVGGFLLYRIIKKEKAVATKEAEPTLYELSGQRR